MPDPNLPKKNYYGEYYSNLYNSQYNAGQSSSGPKSSEIAARKQQMLAQQQAQEAARRAYEQQRLARQQQIQQAQAQAMNEYYNRMDQLAKERARQTKLQNQAAPKNDNYGQGQYYGANFGYQNNIDLSSRKPETQGYGGYFTSYGFQPAPRELPGQVYFTSYGQQNKVGMPDTQEREGEAPIDFRKDGFYGPVKPIRPRANAFGASSVYAAPWEGENGRWAASNGLEYRQINNHYGVPENEGGGGWPGYGDWGDGWNYPKWDYKEAPKRWFENMLTWKI